MIDALSDGFRGVAKRPALLTVPVVVDVLVWLAPRLSVDGLLRRSIPAAADVSALGQPYAQLVEATQALMQDPQATTNLWSAFSLRAIGLASLSAETVTAAPPWRTLPQPIEIQSWPVALACLGLLAAVSLWVGLFVLAVLAQVAREERPSAVQALRVAARTWVRLVALGLAGLLLLAVLGASVMALVLLVSALGTQVANVVMNVAMLSVVGAAAYVSLVGFFFLRAMVLDDTGIRRSLWSALNVVHRSFLSAIGFVALFNIIQVGLLLVWDGIARSVAGTAVSILGNAYINVGLVLGSLIYYRDRRAQWQEVAASSMSGPQAD